MDFAAGVSMFMSVFAELHKIKVSAADLFCALGFLLHGTLYGVIRLPVGDTWLNVNVDLLWFVMYIHTEVDHHLALCVTPCCFFVTGDRPSRRYFPRRLVDQRYTGSGCGPEQVDDHG